MAWEKKNRAAKTTWTTLMLLEQLQATFTKAGSIPMKELAFWKPTQSASARKHEAEGLAIMIDQVFRTIRDAEYEEGVTRLQAIEAMLDILTGADKTVKELAKVNDDNYHFWREQDAT